MADRFPDPTNSPSTPARSALPITPSDATPLTDTPKALFVGTGGTIVGQLADDTTDRTFKNVPAGAVLPFRFKLIKTTGTTAADMLALY